jgi:hypothetical protein
MLFLLWFEMDTFGRLPTDIINIIKDFNQLPTIEVVINENRHQLTIKYSCNIHKFDLISYVSLTERIYTEYLPVFKKFIQDVKNNIPCEYTGIYGGIGSNVQIYYDNKIYIKTSYTYTELHGDSIVLFITAMDKYCNVLNNLYT